MCLYLPHVSQVHAHTCAHMCSSQVNQGQLVPALRRPTLNFPWPHPYCLIPGLGSVPLCESPCFHRSSATRFGFLVQRSLGPAVLGAVAHTGFEWGLGHEHIWGGVLAQLHQQLDQQTKTHLFTRGSSVLATQASICPQIRLVFRCQIISQTESSFKVEKVPLWKTSGGQAQMVGFTCNKCPPARLGTRGQGTREGARLWLMSTFRERQQGIGMAVSG